MKKTAERLITYAKICTTADENGPYETGPSNPQELELSTYLEKELKKLGCVDVSINEFGTVHGLFEGEQDASPVALIAHIDTSPSAPGDNVNPRIISNYDGKDIELSQGIYLKPSDYPNLLNSIGHDLVVTDGKTLLGGDDKAGIAIICTLIERLNKVHHIPLEVVFSTDEEIGVGAEHISFDNLLSKYGYTIDGGDIHRINIENFNASSMNVTVLGRSIHPGDAKDKMINAINVAMEFHLSLPTYMRPEHTQGREGFYHLCEIKGNEEKTELSYIIREHDEIKLKNMEEYALLAAKRLNDRYSENTINLDIKQSYKNMYPKLQEHKKVIDKIVEVYKKKNIPFEFEPIRGGTDGARLTEKGFPCPNLGTGDFNCHGRFEYVDINQMEEMVDILFDFFSLE